MLSRRRMIMNQQQPDWEFVLKKTTSSSETFTMPSTTSSLIYNYIVDWGDGTISSRITSATSSDRLHVYSGNLGQEFTVKLYGTFPRIYNYGMSSNVMWYKINSCKMDIRWIEYGFYGCINLINGIDKIMDCLNPAYITSLSNVWYNCYNLVGTIPSSISRLTGLTSLYAAFAGCSNLTGTVFDISVFAQLTSVTYMYYGCSKLTGYGQPIINAIAAFPSVPTHGYAFTNCTSLSDYATLTTGWK